MDEITGLKITRHLLEEWLPGAEISGGLESIKIGSGREPAVFSIRYNDKCATFILDEGVMLRKTGDNKVFDLRIPTIMPELKEYMINRFPCAL